MRIVALLTAVVLCTAAPAPAFHAGGVADCSVCHTVHQAQDGVQESDLDPAGNPHLLVMKDPSSVCISCHDLLDGTFVVGGDPLDPPAQRAGGSFIFLIEDNLNDAPGGANNPIPGDAAGHNLVAREYGLAADATLTAAPGGDFPAAVLGCTSCHDPHGGGTFRFLHETGDVVAGGAFTFTTPAPDAEGLPIQLAVGPAGHTAYRGGMDAWCGNCHGDFHANGTQLVHPSGRVLGGRAATAYNLYNGTGDIVGGTAATAFLEQVPFEDPANTITGTTGPRPDSRISCVTCHRAHASSAPDAGRWDFGVTFLEQDGVESGSWRIPNPYGPDQRSLCNKCHAKDRYDAPRDPDDPPALAADRGLRPRA
jgi:predicted CXXCH cytochrome family protein